MGDNEFVMKRMLTISSCSLLCLCRKVVGGGGKRWGRGNKGREGEEREGKIERERERE